MELLETELDKINARVERGIAYLDGAMTRMWPYRLDMENFDMNSWGSCILGQFNLPDKYDYSPINVKRGFVGSTQFSNMRGDDSLKAVNKYHNALTHRWKQRVRELRHARRKERTELESSLNPA